MATIRDEAALLASLGANEVMGCLPEAELHSLLRQAAVLSVAEREVVFAEADESSNVLLVLEGYLKLISATVNGREIVLDLVGPGDVFGELASLSDAPRAAAAVALGPVVLLSIAGAQFTRALGRSPSAMQAIIRLLARRLSRATQQMRDGLDTPAPQRLAKALLELAALRSHPVADGLQIDLQLSQRELGGMSGLIRESINKHLGIWRDAGWIRLSDRSITLLRPKALLNLLREQAID